MDANKKITSNMGSLHLIGEVAEQQQPSMNQCHNNQPEDNKTYMPQASSGHDESGACAGNKPVESFRVSSRNSSKNINQISDIVTDSEFAEHMQAEELLAYRRRMFHSSKILEDLMLLSQVAEQHNEIAQMLNRFGYDFIRTDRDGNCFFHALAKHCDLDYLELRSFVHGQATEFMHEQEGMNQAASDEMYSKYPKKEALYRRLLEKDGIETLQNDQEYSDLLDVMLAAPVLKKTIMVVDKNGTALIAVNAQGDLLENMPSLNTIPESENPIVLILDKVHFMTAKKRRNDMGSY